MFKEMNMLRPFFDFPGRRFHLREVSEIVDASPATTTKYLDRFEKEGLICSKRERNFRFSWANLKSKKFVHLKTRYNVGRIIDSGLLDYLDEGLNLPTVFLFGSWAKGENSKKSDLDLFILTESKVELDLSEFEEKLETEIQLFVYDDEEFENLKKENKELVNNIVNGIRLSGFLEVV